MVDPCQGMPAYQVAAVVLNWNNKDDTLACLRSLRQQEGADAHIIVVDNGSTDNSVSEITDHFPDLCVIETGANLGYAAGNNIGISDAIKGQFEYIFVINNDTVLDPSCMANLVTELRRCPHAGAAAPKSLFLDQPDLIYFAGGVIGSDGGTIHVGIGVSDGPQYCQASDAEWLTGCAIMFRKEALRRVGLFEPKYFLLYEDADWSLRARKAGYVLRFAPKARLWHKTSSSFGATWSSAYMYYHTRNSFLWLERNFSPASWPHLYRCGVKRAFARVDGLDKIDSQVGSRELRKAVWRGMVDYVLRRFGERVAG